MMTDRKIVIRNDKWVLTLTTSNQNLAEILNGNVTVKQAFLNSMNLKNRTNFEPHNTEIIDITGKHICRYCGEIAEGTYEDLLCEDCRCTFGHSLYSEL